MAAPAAKRIAASSSTSVEATPGAIAAASSASDGQNQGTPPSKVVPRLLFWTPIVLAAIVAVFLWRNYYLGNEARQEAVQAENAVTVCSAASDSLLPCRLVGDGVTTWEIDTSRCSAAVYFQPLPNSTFADAWYLPSGLADVQANYIAWTNSSEDQAARADRWRVRPFEGKTFDLNYRCAG